MIANTTDAGLATAVFFNKVQEAMYLCRVINNKFSQKIIKLLDENSSLTVTEILIKLRMLQSVASQHLAILRRAGIVTNRRQGKQIYYELDYNTILRVKKFVESLMNSEML